MRTNLKYVKLEKSVNGTTVTVNEYAEVNLKSILSLELLNKTPMVPEYIEKFSKGKHGNCTYDNGVLYITGTGIAKCHPDDDFNEKTGFHIAQSRASLKIIKTYKRFMLDIINLIETTFLCPIEDIAARLWDAEFALEDHIKLDLIAE